MFFSARHLRSPRAYFRALRIKLRLFWSDQARPLLTLFWTRVRKFAAVAGLALVTWAVAMIDIGEHGFAVAVLCVALAAFWIQITDWSGVQAHPALTAWVKAVGCVAVFVLISVLAAVAYAKATSSSWSNLLDGGSPAVTTLQTPTPLPVQTAASLQEPSPAMAAPPQPAGVQAASTTPTPAPPSVTKRRPAVTPPKKKRCDWEKTILGQGKCGQNGFSDRALREGGER